MKFSWVLVQAGPRFNNFFLVLVLPGPRFLNFASPGPVRNVGPQFWSAISVRGSLGKMTEFCFIVIYFISEFTIHREVNGALALDWSIDTTAPP